MISSSINIINISCMLWYTFLFAHSFSSAKSSISVSAIRIKIFTTTTVRFKIIYLWVWFNVKNHNEVLISLRNKGEREQNRRWNCSQFWNVTYFIFILLYSFMFLCQSLLQFLLQRWKQFLTGKSALLVYLIIQNTPACYSDMTLWIL